MVQFPVRNPASTHVSRSCHDWSDIAELPFDVMLHSQRRLDSITVHVRLLEYLRFPRKSMEFPDFRTFSPFAPRTFLVTIGCKVERLGYHAGHDAAGQKGGTTTGGETGMSAVTRVGVGD
jgi:hypothetical protein